jgi:hypothetical protein
MRLKLWGVSVFLSLLSATTVLAVGSMQLDVTKSDYQKQRALIMQAISADKDYAETSDSDRKKITEAFSRIDQKMDSTKTFSDLADLDKKQVMDDQQVVNKSLSQAASDSRLICRSASEIGSNLKKRICVTQASKNRQAQAVREAGEPKRTN